MADQKLTALSAASGVAGTDKLYLVQGTNSRRATVQDILDLAGGGGADNAYSSRTALAGAATPAADKPAILGEPGRAGIFVWDTPISRPR